MSYTEQFLKSLNFVLRAEGGWSDDKDDPGGATNLGIIQTEYDLYRREHNLPQQSVRNITLQEAQDIYYNKYWLASHANGMPAGLDTVVFDTAVNMGVGTAIAMLCQTLKVGVAVQFSPQLSSAVHNLHDVQGAISTYLVLRKRRYYGIVARRPTSRKFLNGWLNRLGALARFVGV